MAYVKNIWVDQDVERPKTYEVTNNQDGSITLTDSFGLVTELGTPVNEVNMNHIEEGIEGCAIRKHNLTETFDLGEWVLGGTGENESFYKSLIPNNVGNAITNNTAWEKVELSGSSRNIGEIVASTIPLTDAGLHLLDGSLISGSGSYADFVTYIAGLYNSGDYTAIFDTEVNWQSAVSTYGVCGKFVYNSNNNTVRLPKYGNQIVTKSSTGTLPIRGTGVTLGVNNDGSSSAGYLNLYRSNYNEAIYKINGSDARGNMYITTDSTKSGIVADASSLSNSSIGCYFYIVIATSTKTDIEVDIDEVVTDLNSKADRDLTNTVPTSAFASVLNSVNIVTATDIYINGYSGYIQFANGTLIQWGRQSSVSHRTNTEITLLKSYTSQNFAVITSCCQLGFVGTSTISAEPSANNKIIIYQSNSANVTMNCGWMTIGK